MPKHACNLVRQVLDNFLARVGGELGQALVACPGKRRHDGNVVFAHRQRKHIGDVVPRRGQPVQRADHALSVQRLFLYVTGLGKHRTRSTWTRFLNEARGNVRPNTRFQWSQDHVVHIVTTRSISPGEELLIHYN
jgi:hypothetical protein